MLTRRRFFAAACVVAGGAAVGVSYRRWSLDMSGIEPILARIDGIRSLDDDRELTILTEARAAFFARPDAADHLVVWFRLFERFPEDDGYGVLKAVLHDIERVSGYERWAVASVAARPSRFPLMMIERMVNSGQRQCDGVGLLDLLSRVASDATCPASVSADARHFLANCE